MPESFRVKLGERSTVTLQRTCLREPGWRVTLSASAVAFVARSTACEDLGAAVRGRLDRVVVSERGWLENRRRLTRLRWNLSWRATVILFECPPQRGPVAGERCPPPMFRRGSVRGVGPGVVGPPKGFT
jgi:hypothetical protein